MTETYRPFSCGSQAEDWMASNCDRCSKGVPGPGRPRCPILDAVRAAWFGDGEVAGEMARRMGYLDDAGAPTGRRCWPCREVDWTPEWREEWHRRHPEEVPS